ncbi:MAG: pyrimidine-nucleoside phosphorylase, partial [Dethiobacteria bacterium]|nr:pyrimidine-nucleoside phosphorylase [Dethiobacteria bacterium]
LKDRDEAFALARAMVEIGNGAGRETVAVITNMDQPLGHAVGNALEVEEAILTLRGEGPPDLEELCLVLGGWMLVLAGKAPDQEQGKAQLKKLIENGAALRKFKELIRNQHGNDAVTEDLALLPAAAQKIKVRAGVDSCVGRLQAEIIGIAAMTLGAGRENKNSQIDPAVGIMIEKKIGDKVKASETLAVIHAGASTEAKTLDSVEKMILSAYSFVEEPVDLPVLILGSVDQKER